MTWWGQLCKKHVVCVCVCVGGGQIAVPSQIRWGLLTTRRGALILSPPWSASSPLYQASLLDHQGPPTLLHPTSVHPFPHTPSSPTPSRSIPLILPLLSHPNHPSPQSTHTLIPPHTNSPHLTPPTVLQPIPPHPSPHCPLPFTLTPPLPSPHLTPSLKADNSVTITNDNSTHPHVPRSNCRLLYYR